MPNQESKPRSTGPPLMGLLQSMLESSAGGNAPLPSLLSQAFLGIRFLAVGGGDAEPEMPLADHGGGVAIVPEETRNSQTTRGDQGFTVSIEDSFLKFSTPVVAARHDAVSRGSAHRRGGVRISEGHAILGELIHVRGRQSYRALG